MQAIMEMLKPLMALVMSIIAFIGGIFTGSPSVPKGDLELVTEYSYTYDEGLSFGQGITTDGEYFYGFGTLKVIGYCAITKIDAKTGEIVKSTGYCVPDDLLKKGYTHFGDGDYDDGKLYVAVEDTGFKNPAVMVYDAETLEYLDCYIIPEEGVGDGHIPWCLVSNGVIYYSQFDNVTEIKMISLADGSYLGSIKLNDELFAVQGGDFDGGYLYLATDDGDGKVRKTYKINMLTGECEVVFERDLGIGTAEAEGLCICEFENGSKYHFVDVDAQVKIRSYK